MASQTTRENGDRMPCHPSVVWAQRKDKLWVTVQLGGCKQPNIDLKETILDFKGTGGPNKVLHEVKLELYGEIIPDDSKFTIGGREIIFMLKKKDPESKFWPRLLQDTKKVHYLKTDFDKWKDEDDSDVDDGEDANLEQMMQSMGGLGGPGMMGGNPMDAGDADAEDDSDDEDLPDLQ